MGPEFILIVVALGAFIVFQVFQGRKRRRETEDRQSKFVPGVEIMTNYGVYGTILSLDEETNLAMIETTPGTVLKIHRQTILKVADYAPVEDETADGMIVDDADVVDADADRSVSDTPVISDTGARLDEPAFGERVERNSADVDDSTIIIDDGTTPAPKPARGAKRVDE